MPTEKKDFKEHMTTSHGHDTPVSLPNMFGCEEKTENKKKNHNNNNLEQLFTGFWVVHFR